MPEPSLNSRPSQPRGVIRPNLKMFLYMGAIALVILAAVFSAMSPKRGQPIKNGPPQPLLQDSTDANARALQNQLLEEQKQPYRPVVDPDYAPGGKYFGCVPGQPCTPKMMNQSSEQQQMNPEQQQAQQLAARERELAYNSRFSSNIAWARAVPAQAQKGVASSLIPAHPAGQPGPDGEAAAEESKRRPEVNIDSSVGQPYVLYEGTTVDTILMNRLDGDAPGPVKVLVSNPVYSHDMQHVIIPEGTVVLGEARKIGAAGFGRQRRIAVVFHRMIMPDGYSVDLDQFSGLDQIGEMGLKDKVNNHYLQIFGTSIALGVIAGAAEVEMGGGALTGSGSQLFTTGASASLSSSATTILDRFIQIPPTITIREGHRVKVFFMQDMLLPSYENHRIPQTF
jgi:type IV secretion system protein VirB10